MKLIFTYILSLISLAVSSQTITTIAGTGVWACSGIGGTAAAASVGQLNSVAVDGAGNMYIGSGNCRKVFRITPGGIITTYVGTGVGGSTGDGGPATNATIGGAYSLAIDQYGNLFISDFENSVIRKVNAAGTISTIAGDASVTGGGYSGDGGPATAALLQMQQGIALDTAGNLYVADYGNNIIRKIAVTGVITRVAGNGSPTYSGDGGAALAAGLRAPCGVAVDRNGNIYISEDITHRVRKVTPGGIITCVAGNGTAGYTGDGSAATSATLKYPHGLATDKFCNVFIADGGNHAIRMVDNNGVITTFAGIGGAGHSGDGGPAFMAMINYPSDIAIDGNGHKYIAELNGGYLRKTDTCLAPLVPPIAGGSNLCVGDSVFLTNTSTGGVWTVDSPAIATIDTAGTLWGIARGRVTVTYSKTNACVTVAQTISVTVGPFAGAIFAPGHTPSASGIDTFCYNAYLAITGSPGGIWGITDTTKATISSSGWINPYFFGEPDTAFYVVTDSCGSDTAYYPFVIEWCPDLVRNTPAENAGLMIYPNPATNEVNVAGAGIIGEINIVNVVGKVVFRTYCTANKLTIDVHALPAGLYMVQAAGLAPKRIEIKSDER